MSNPMLGAGAWVTPNVRLERPLGAGGMGSVWVAEHTTLRTRVVVKLMRPELARDPETLSRFSREAAALANVKSPHVVQVFDHGVTQDGSPFITMELLEGEDLGARLKRGAVPPDEAAVIVSQTCKALARVHERGIVHRDVKPQNVFLCSGFGEAFVKVLDFGIAKAGGDLQVGLDTTSTGAVMGTPYYMSPEQALGHKTLDFKTDIWAMGVLAFEMCTGHKPFLGDTVGALAVAICTQPLPLPSSINPALGAAVDAWFQRACAREPSARFSSAKELADAFAVAVAGPTSLGLAKTVASVPPQAIPVLSSTTNGPTSRAPSAPAPSTSSHAAAIVAVIVALAFLGLGGALLVHSRMVASPPPVKSVATPHATQPVDRSAGGMASASPATSNDAIPIESLPLSSSSSIHAPLHAPAQTHGSPQNTGSPQSTTPSNHGPAHPASSFDRNSID